MRWIVNCVLAATLLFGCDDRVQDGELDAETRISEDQSIERDSGPEPAITDSSVDVDAQLDQLVDAEADAAEQDHGVDWGGIIDAEVPDAIPEPELVAREGFSVGEIRTILTLVLSDEPPPNPTNRFADDFDVALLGQAFFFADDLGPTFVNCVTCHDPHIGFTRPLSYDGQGGLNFRNAPPLVGVAHQSWLFWDGRADTLWSQVMTPLEHRDEMNSDRLFIAHVIFNRPDYRRAYESAFGPMPDLSDEARFPPRGRPGYPDEVELTEPWWGMAEADRHAVNVVFANVGKAFEAFMRRLSYGPSTFDRYAEALVTGDEVPLRLMPQAAKNGLKLFIGEAGCISCHYGPVFSDGRFHNLGTGANPLDRRPLGRTTGIDAVLAHEFNAASRYSDEPGGERAQRLTDLQASPLDEGAFRTPTLRGVHLSAPYGHDGRFPDLTAIIQYKLAPDNIGPGQRDPSLIPIDLSDDEIADLRSFLETLASPPLPRELRSPPRDFVPED